MTRPLRFGFNTLVIFIVAAMIGAKPAAPRPGARNEVVTKASTSLIVHEWGTFTSIAGKDGVAVEWRPLNGSSDLPGFVYDASGLASGTGLRNRQRCIKCDMEALVRMETPVIYFYAGRQTTVSVRVDFSRGKITEWYPQARVVYVPGTGDGRNPSTIDWGRITVTPGDQESFPVEAKESHYYPARETDAAPLRVCGDKGEQREKFLFYRGVGTFDPPLAARLDGDRVVASSTGHELVTKLVLFERRNGRMGYVACDSFDPEAIIQRPVLNENVDSLERTIEAMLVDEGLYEKEARAMINTWRDSWFEEGMRVFYIVPRNAIDSILPISIDPQPSELTRLLVGRAEIITPEIEQEIESSVASLADSERNIERVSAEIVHKHGRFAEPVLKAVLEKSSNPGFRARVQQLIDHARIDLR